MKVISGNLDRQIKKETITEEMKNQTLKNISASLNLEESVANAGLVIEAATENAEVKFKIFQVIDQKAPQEAILATNTSSISVTEIAGKVKRPGKVIGMHFMNPVPMMKLVEIIAGSKHRRRLSPRFSRSRKSLKKSRGGK